MVVGARQAGLRVPKSNNLLGVKKRQQRSEGMSYVVIAYSNLNTPFYHHGEQ